MSNNFNPAMRHLLYRSSLWEVHGGSSDINNSASTNDGIDADQSMVLSTQPLGETWTKKEHFMYTTQDTCYKVRGESCVTFILTRIKRKRRQLMTSSRYDNSSTMQIQIEARCIRSHHIMEGPMANSSTMMVSYFLFEAGCSYETKVVVTKRLVVAEVLVYFNLPRYTSHSYICLERLHKHLLFLMIRQ